MVLAFFCWFCRRSGRTMKTVEVPLDELVRQTVSLIEARLFCIVDVGATNVRVAVVPRLSASKPIAFVKARASNRAEFLRVLQRVAAALGPAVQAKIAAAAVAVPGPVQDGVARIANYGAKHEGEDVGLRDLPPALFPAGATTLLNDLESAAMGLVGVSRVGAFPAHFSRMWKGSVDKSSAAALPEGHHTLVVAPGTGLGSALLMWDAAARRHVVLPLEFGHTNIATKHDHAFLARYERAMARGSFLPEYDDLCTGRGLQALYADECGGATQPADKDAGAIVALAREGDAKARRALLRYFKFLMVFSGHMVMGMQAFCVVLCGDNVVHNGFFLAEDANATALKAELLDHSSERMGFLSRASVVRQTVSLNLNLVGCAQSALTMRPAAKL